MFTWLSNILQRRSTLDFANDFLINDSGHLWNVRPSASGVRVDELVALGNPALWRAVNLIADNVAKLPLYVYKRDEKEGRKRADTDPAYWLLAKRPSDRYTPFVWKHTMIKNVLLHGNGYSLIVRDVYGKPDQLLILDPTLTYPKLVDGRIVYVTSIDGQQRTIPFTDMLHFKGLCADDGLTGYSILDVMRDALGLGIALQRHGASYFKHGGKPGLIGEFPPGFNSADEEKKERFRKQWAEAHSGPENAGKTAFVPSGMKFTTIPGMSNEEGQWLQAREFDLVQISDALKCPPSFLGSTINTSYGSLEADQLNFLCNSLDGILVMIEQECDTKMLTENQKLRDTHYCEFLRDAAIAIDTKTKEDLLLSQLNGGGISFAEYRNMKNRPTEKDIEADEWRLPSNVSIQTDEPDPEPVPQAPPLDQPEEQPEAPAEPQPEDEQASEPQGEGAGDNAETKLRAMGVIAMDRLVNRLKKSVTSGKVDLVQHRSVFVDSLAPFDRAEQFTDDLLSRLTEELEAVLPEQREAIVERLEPSKLMEELWQN